MRVSILTVFLFALAATSYSKFVDPLSVDCSGCDSRATRADRIACRFLCWFNENDGNKNLTREQARKMFSSLADANGNVNYAKFQETWKSVAKEFGCEERVRVCFDLFASLSGKDDTTVINIADLDALIDFLAGVGVDVVTPAQFMEGAIAAINLLEELVPCP